MNELTKAIAVGQYPAPCFDETWDSKEHQHRRFLRRLAEQETIRIVDSAGTPLNVKAVVTGGIHFYLWHVDAHDAQVILDQIEVEAGRREEERQKAAEAARKAAEEREAERKCRDEEWKAKCAELKMAGLWTHPQYKPLKVARADGWHRLKEHEYGGEQISLKGHTLVRNPKVAWSKSWWGEAGYSIKPGEQPHGQKAGEHGWYDVYREDQVEQTPPVPEGRICLECRNRLPLERFLDNERICVTCWNQRDEQEASKKANQRAEKQIEKDRRDYLKKTSFLPH